MDFTKYVITNQVLMKQVMKATSSIQDPTTRLAECVNTYIELGGKFRMAKTINKITKIPLPHLELEETTQKEPQNDGASRTPKTETRHLDGFKDFKPKNNKRFRDVENLEPPEMKKQTAIIEINENIEADTESDIQSVSCEQEQIEGEPEDEIDFGDAVEVIGDLEKLESGEFRYQVAVNGKTIKFGDKLLPDVEALKKRFSPRKIQIMINKIKSNYKIINSDDINSRNFWNSRIFLSNDIWAEYLKIKDIYN